jgi:hypothetical protein
MVSLARRALSERREDIPLLWAHFIEQLAVRYKAGAHLFPEAMELLRTLPGRATCDSCSTSSSRPLRCRPRGGSRLARAAGPT